MTRKDFILISSAIRAAKEGLLAKLPNDTPIRQAMLNSIELSALHIGKALLAEQGARFDFGRFLTDCGYGAAHRMPEGLAGDQPIPESQARGDYLDENIPGVQSREHKHWEQF